MKNLILCIKKSILRGDKQFNKVSLSSLQTTGTSFQKETYAQITAVRIVKENPSLLKNYQN
jgi:hypothetical protein